MLVKRVLGRLRSGVFVGGHQENGEARGAARAYRVGRALARHRRGALAPRLDHALVRLHQGYENLDYDFASNGERRVLERLAEAGGVSVIFDVGANVGDWTRLVRELFPRATVHCFEIVPKTYKQLAAALADDANVHVHGVGLSDQAGETYVNCVPGGSGVATVVDGITEEFFGVQTERVSVRVAVGDEICAERGVRGIDVLKLDVEGAEYEVLCGFEKMLAAGAIKVVQFEYGYVNIVTKRLLRDFHELLEGAGMAVGKIYPNYVEFRAYKLQHEDFLGPNFLAVHRSQERMIAALS